MSDAPTEPSDSSADELQLEQLRNILLGEGNQQITDTVRANARELVAEVVTEAIKDRQTGDGSIDKVLMPIVESSVDTSVSSRSDKLVSSLYPLVGSLVRKSVSAFLTDFMEKTNQLLENSFTLKGLKWRIQAWQSSVSFAQYVASQTFVYRVEHVLLIHRETGLLLKSVDLDQQSRGDADLISSMLSAINDFVGDSFASDTDELKQDLNTITTDNFSLLIKTGPQAMIVAAVSGNPPQTLADHLQVTLESIHSLYDKELRQYEGDSEAFENTEQELRRCLMSEQKPEAQSRSPWMAWVLVGALLLIAGYASYRWWHSYSVAQTLRTIDQNPGILITSIERGDTTELHLLRDPDALPIAHWLEQRKLQSEPITIIERPYISLDPAMVRLRAARALKQYPQLEHFWEDKRLHLNGALSPYQKQQLWRDLRAMGVAVDSNIDQRQLVVQAAGQAMLPRDQARQLFDSTRSKVNAMQLDFDKGSSELNEEMLAILEQLTLQIKQLKHSADSLGLQFGLLIIGVSDNTGSKIANANLSQQRALSAQQALIELGIPEQNMYTSGLGQINISAVGQASRKVLFNVLYIQPNTQPSEESPEEGTP